MFTKYVQQVVWYLQKNAPWKRGIIRLFDENVVYIVTSCISTTLEFLTYSFDWILNPFHHAMLDTETLSKNFVWLINFCVCGPHFLYMSMTWHHDCVYSVSNRHVCWHTFQEQLINCIPVQIRLTDMISFALFRSLSLFRSPFSAYFFRIFKTVRHKSNINQPYKQILEGRGVSHSQLFHILSILKQWCWIHQKQPNK